MRQGQDRRSDAMGKGTKKRAAPVLFKCSEDGEIEGCPGGEYSEAGKVGKAGKERRSWRCCACAEKDNFFTGTTAHKLEQHYEQYHSATATNEYQSCGEDVSKRPAHTNECVMLVSNVAKQHNLGEMVRSAVAFGATSLYTVGREDKIKTFGNQGTMGFLARFRAPALALDTRAATFTLPYTMPCVRNPFCVPGGVTANH
jgi:hypothetical protein